ncbi:PREDICTED: uncharacterized protein LOC106807109 [Priapulus caudatus]|uniref:Uncharacterized protein LOC106807109 n=1 Tax=Priapulus caudatus TaxID=37621 RepID=A0ABM1DY31_PRICU|nr:PREDICTED: uncharacterized protein LOC106807109 [Priapulus caudatus]
MEGGFTIIAWRGQWELLNVYLAPNRIYTSLWAGYGIGVAICLLAFALQPVVAGMSRRLDEQHVAYKTVLETVFIGIANFGAINMWRALWHAYNVYIWPPEDVDIYHYTQKSCWLTLGVASVLMMALANLKGAITSGVDIDGSYMNGDGCWFHVHYTSDVISQIRGGAFTKKRTGPKGKGIRRLLRNTLYSENGPMHFLAAIAAQINVGGLPTTGDNAADSVNGFPSTGSLPRLTVDPLPMEEDNPAFEANSEGVASPGEQETRPRFSLIVAEPNRRASIFMPDSGDNDDDDDDEPEFGVVPVDSRKGSYLEVVTRNSLPDRNGSIYEIRQTTDRRRSMFETQQAAQKTTRAGSPTKKDAPPKKDTPL